MRDATRLFEFLHPNIENWIKMLLVIDHPKDIEYCTLINKIEDPNQLETLNAWATALGPEELYSTFAWVYLELNRNLSFELDVSVEQYPFAIARLLCFKLSHVIRSWCGNPRRYLQKVSLYPDMDWIQVSNETELNVRLSRLKLTPYQNYLYALFLSDCEGAEITELTMSQTAYNDLRRTLHEHSNQG